MLPSLLPHGFSSLPLPKKLPSPFLFLSPLMEITLFPESPEIPIL
jgi:hypothetical protein